MNRLHTGNPHMETIHSDCGDSALRICTVGGNGSVSLLPEIVRRLETRDVNARRHSGKTEARDPKTNLTPAFQSI